MLQHKHLVLQHEQIKTEIQKRVCHGMRGISQKTYSSVPQHEHPILRHKQSNGKCDENGHATT